MGSAWRIEYEGAFYHILSQGNKARVPDCDPDHFWRSLRISKTERDDHDIAVFSIWKTGILSNEKIVRLFGIMYSSISHIVKSVRLRREENRDLEEKLNQDYSLFKI